MRARAVLTRKCGLLREPHLDLLLDAPRFGHLVCHGAAGAEPDVRRESVGGDGAVGLQGGEEEAVGAHAGGARRFLALAFKIQSQKKGKARS